MIVADDPGTRAWTWDARALAQFLASANVEQVGVAAFVLRQQQMVVGDGRRVDSLKVAFGHVGLGPQRRSVGGVKDVNAVSVDRQDQQSVLRVVGQHRHDGEEPDSFAFHRMLRGRVVGKRLLPDNVAGFRIHGKKFARAPSIGASSAHFRNVTVHPEQPVSAERAGGCLPRTRACPT